MGATPARAIAASAATTPRSAAERLASVPPNFPIGVRTAERMKTDCIGLSMPVFEVLDVRLRTIEIPPVNCAQVGHPAGLQRNRGSAAGWTTKCRTAPTCTLLSPALLHLHALEHLL